MLHKFKGKSLYPGIDSDDYYAALDIDKNISKITLEVSREREPDECLNLIICNGFIDKIKFIGEMNDLKNGTRSFIDLKRNTLGDSLYINECLLTCVEDALGDVDYYIVVEEINIETIIYHIEDVDVLYADLSKTFDDFKSLSMKG